MSASRLCLALRLQLACQRGKLVLSCSPEAWFQDALAPAGIEVFELTPEIAVRAVGLSSIHRDPFDRIIMRNRLGASGRVGQRG